MSTGMNDFSKLELNATLAAEIIRGVQETMTAMAGVKPQPGSLRIERNCEVEGDISGIINVVQETVDGTLIVSFPKETIFFILEKLFRRPFTEMDRPVKEGVGEFTNIIYGVIKKNLNQAGFNFKMALPTVVLGLKHVVTSAKGDETMIVPFSIEEKPFSVMLTIVKK